MLKTSLNVILIIIGIAIFHFAFTYGQIMFWEQVKRNSQMSSKTESLVTFTNKKVKLTYKGYWESITGLFD